MSKKTANVTSNSALENKARSIFSVSSEQMASKSMFLYINKMPFTMVVSGGVYELYSNEWNCKSVDKTFDPKSMNFVKKIKKYIKDHYVAMKFIDKDYKNSVIKYIDVNSKINVGDVFEDICCLDIKNAYWQTALLMGVISEEIFNSGTSIDKITRLASLGSLAKKKEVYSFDGETYKLVEIIRSYETENIWFAICSRVSDIMQNMVSDLGDDFLFYWVDGIYFKRTEENIKKVTEFLHSCAYDLKEEQVSKVEFLKDHFNVYSTTGKEVKKFGWILGKKKSKSEMISIPEMKRALKVTSEILREKDF
jgi:hypothetical protein